VVYRAVRNGKKGDFLVHVITETVSAQTTLQIPDKFLEAVQEQGTGAKFTIAKDDLPVTPKEGDLIFELIQDGIVPQEIRPTGTIYKVGHVRPVVFKGNVEFYEIFAEVSEFTKEQE